jgi:hypothetical protein
VATLNGQSRASRSASARSSRTSAGTPRGAGR